ncbi:MAG: hypothetical protein Q8M55_02775, partial [Actinomycetota bacterium]|nr:hypothetical protein [Actinomycetota bacterium]
GVLTLVIVGIVGAGVFNGISRAADDSDYPPEDATFDPGDAPADPPDYGGLTLEQLLGYAGEAGEPEYLEVQYLGGGEWYGGNDVLLNFAIVGSDPGDEFMTPLTADIPCFIDSERVSFPEYYAATYESAEKRGMIVIDSYGVLELHVFTQGQAASSDAAGRPPAPGMTSRAPRAILPRSCSSCKTRAAAS